MPAHADMHLCVWHVLEDEPPEEDQFGRMAYLQKCQELGINPASQILRFLEVMAPH